MIDSLFSYSVFQLTFIKRFYSYLSTNMLKLYNLRPPVVLIMFYYILKPNFNTLDIAVFQGSSQSLD